jgi:hypothetical protein
MYRQKTNAIKSGLSWRPSLLSQGAKSVLKINKSNPEIDMEFFEEAVDYNTRAAQSIFDEFNLRQDMNEFTENLTILIEKHLNDKLR